MTAVQALQLAIKPGRWMGLIVIVALWAILLHEAFQRALHPREPAIPRASIEGNWLRPGSAERFMPWASRSPDPYTG